MLIGEIFRLVIQQRVYQYHWSRCSYPCPQTWRTFSQTSGIIDFRRCIFKYKVVFQVWDTGGQERYRPVLATCYKNAFGVILVYDVSNKKSFANLQQWLAEVNEFASTDLPKLLIGKPSKPCRAVPRHDPLITFFFDRQQSWSWRTKGDWRVHSGSICSRTRTRLHRDFCHWIGQHPWGIFDPGQATSAPQPRCFHGIHVISYAYPKSWSMCHIIIIPDIKLWAMIIVSIWVFNLAMVKSWKRHEVHPCF